MGRFTASLLSILVFFLATTPEAATGPKRTAAAPVGSPKEEGSKTADAGSTACSAGSEALLKALLNVFEPTPPEIRVLAVEDLALLGDARALNPLSQLILDLNPAVQAAAIRAVSRFQTPRAEEILSNVVRHPMISETLKTQALEALVFQRSPSARDFLLRVSTTTSFSYNLRTTARKVLQQWGPLPSR